MHLFGANLKQFLQLFSLQFGPYSLVAVHLIQYKIDREIKWNLREETHYIKTDKLVSFRNPFVAQTIDKVSSAFDGVVTLREWLQDLRQVFG